MLKFQRILDIPSAYYASDDTKRYRVFKAIGAMAKTTSAWRLEILDLRITAGITHAIGQPVIREGGFETRALAYAVANAYSDLGDGYKEHEHRHASRWTNAIDQAYSADKASR